MFAPFRSPLSTNGVFCQETTAKEVDLRTRTTPPQTTPLRQSISYGDAIQNNSQISENLHSILKNSDSWKQYSSTEDK